MKKKVKGKRICTKAKGTKAERELFHMFWENGWGCARVAGSGSTQRPATDLLASDGSKVLALECKAIKNDKKYFSEADVEQILHFSTKFGAEPWIAMRFDNIGWFFVHMDNLAESKGKSFFVSLDFAKKKGKTFDELVGKFEQTRLVEE